MACKTGIRRYLIPLDIRVFNPQTHLITDAFFQFLIEIGISGIDIFIILKIICDVHIQCAGTALNIIKLNIIARIDIT